MYFQYVSVTADHIDSRQGPEGLIVVTLIVFEVL